jgi:membrane protease subunit HflK
MQQIVDRYGAGVQITNVTMQGVQPPEQVQAAFDDAVRAGQDRERFKNEGQAYANDVVPKAKGVAARLVEEANGYRQSVISTAKGDAARFTQVLGEYQKAPQVTRERIYLETMQQVFQATSKVIVDQKQGQSLLYLPLSQLMQLSQQGAGSSPVDVGTRTPTPEPSTVTPTPDVVPPVSRREGMRSRDREGGR